MNAAAASFHDWCSYNRLTINADKSKCIIFSNKSHYRRAIKNEVNISIDHVNLETVDKYKCLGIMLDENLSFIYHVNYTTSILSNKLYMLRKIRQYIDEETALLLHKTMILSYFDLRDFFMIAATSLFLPNFRSSKTMLKM